MEVQHDDEHNADNCRGCKVSQLRPAHRPDDHDYLADYGPKPVKPVDELQRIAMSSRDIGARLAAIRRLAQMLGDRPFAPPSTEAKWKVICIPPGEPGHRDYQPPEADAA